MKMMMRCFLLAAVVALSAAQSDPIVIPYGTPGNCEGTTVGRDEAVAGDTTFQLQQYNDTDAHYCLTWNYQLQQLPVSINFDEMVAQWPLMCHVYFPVPAGSETKLVNFSAPVREGLLCMNWALSDGREPTQNNEIVAFQSKCTQNTLGENCTDPWQTIDPSDTPISLDAGETFYGKVYNYAGLDTENLFVEMFSIDIVANADDADYAAAIEYVLSGPFGNDGQNDGACYNASGCEISSPPFTQTQSDTYYYFFKIEAPSDKNIQWTLTRKDCDPDRAGAGCQEYEDLSTIETNGVPYTYTGPTYFQILPDQLWNETTGETLSFSVGAEDGDGEVMEAPAVYFAAENLPFPATRNDFIAVDWQFQANRIYDVTNRDTGNAKSYFYYVDAKEGQKFTVWLGTDCTSLCDECSENYFCACASDRAGISCENDVSEFPVWAIVLIVVGVVAIIGLIIAAVVMTRKDDGYQQY